MAFASKWSGFTCAIYLQMVGGLSFAFSLYAGQLKLIFGFNQTQLEGLGTALGAASGVVGYFPSLVYDALRDRPHLGPRVTALLAVACHFVGYITIWAAAAGHIYLPYPVLLIMGVIASSTTATVDSACTGTEIRNFPNDRGHVVGVQKAFLGLSASVATSIYVAVFAPSALNFLLFIALLPLGVGAFTIPFLNHVPFIEKSEVEGWWSTGGRFGIAYMFVSVLAIYQLGVALAGVAMPLSRTAAIGTLVGTMVILALTIGMPFTCGGWTGGIMAVRADPVDEGDAEGVKAKLLPGTQVQEPEAKPVARRSLSRSVLAVEEKQTVWQSLLSLNFWLLWISLVVGMGTGNAFLNNVGEFVESLGGTPERTPVLVSIYSIMNCAGRMFCGLTSERALHRWGTPRTLAMAITLLYTALACLFTAFSNLNMLYVATALLGLSVGSFWSLMTVLTSEVFGMLNFGTVLSLMHIAPTVGSLIFATQVAGNLYTQEARKQGNGNVCFGTACFRNSFLILAACNAAACSLSFALYWRTRYIYRKKAPTPIVILSSDGAAIDS